VQCTWTHPETIQPPPPPTDPGAHSGVYSCPVVIKIAVEGEKKTTLRMIA